jgi:uncharacterized protein with GYD domain
MLLDAFDITVRQSCFESFKHAYPMWQEILYKYNDLHKFNAAGKTIAQRTRTFKKICDRMETMVRQIYANHVHYANVHITQADSSAALYGFQFAIVMAGSVVNEDASLGRMFETDGVKGVIAIHA